MMDIHTATEVAYKNGYAKGFADGKTEAAREIFDEIDHLTFSFGYGVRRDHTVTHTRSIDDDLLAERKKKYTEGET